MSRIFLTESERRILQLLGKNASLSKAQFSDLGGMSWATVVKMTKRLLDRGIIVESGTAVNKTKPGKKEILYSLSRDALLAVGVDVEYSFTRLVLMNLKGDVIAEDERPTPQNPTAASLRSFLLQCLDRFLARLPEKRPHIVGAGIGLPGIVIPAWLKPDIKDNRRNLEDFLSTALGVPVSIEINARACTNYVKWNNPFFPGEDFMFVSIRTGVGMGIIFRGELFIGHQFISGELGHIKVARKNGQCRCGGRGCLETVLSQTVLYAQYRKSVLGAAPIQHPSASEIITGLHDLFSRAAGGDRGARGVVRQAAVHLGKALSHSLMTIFIPNIIISGHFGKDGGMILPLLERELAKNLLPSMAVDLRYLPIEGVPFAQGDALLAINAYLNSGRETTRTKYVRAEAKG